jgi:hypothetical protein
MEREYRDPQYRKDDRSQLEKYEQSVFEHYLNRADLGLITREQALLFIGNILMKREFKGKD